MRATWAERSFSAAVYDFGVEREWLARPAGRLLWGTDVGLLYSSIRSLGTLPSGTSVLDVPCGGGLALRGLPPSLRYVGADIAPRAATLSQVAADIERLPFADNEFDVCVTFNGLHCVPDPAAALRELARCLKPGGKLLGDTIVRGAGRRYDLTIGAFQRVGLFGPGGTAEDLARWLADAGFRADTLTHSGAVVHFAATRAS